jgi:excisionase family DNA binding protein
MESLKSIEQAAELWGVSAWTVRAYVRQGKITPVRIGRRVLIEPFEIARIVAEGRGKRNHAPDVNSSRYETASVLEADCCPVSERAVALD